MFQRFLLWGLAVLLLIIVVLVGGLTWLVYNPHLLAQQIETRASAAIGRDVDIRGDLSIDPGWVTEVRASDVVIANADWAQGPLATIDGLGATLDLSTLLRDWRLVMPEVSLLHPVLSLQRNADGELNLPQMSSSSDEGAQTQAGGSSVQVGTLRIEKGDLSYKDAAADLQLRANVASQAAPGESAGFSRLVAEGSGSYRGQDVTFDLTVGSPMTLREEGVPFPVEGTLAMGDTTLKLDGQVDRPMELAGVVLDVQANSPNPAPLLALFGAKPDSQMAPLSLKAHVERPETAWQAKEVSLGLGNSDLAGSLSYDPSGERPSITADLASNLVDVPQVRSVIGAFAGESDQSQSGQGFDLSTLRSYDGKISYQAKAIRLPELELTDVAFDGSLENGRLQVNPMAANLPKGAVTLQATADASTQTPEATVDGTLKSVPVGRLLAAMGLESGLQATVSGTAKGTLRGADLADVLRQSEATASLKASDIVLPQAEGTPKVENATFELALDQGKLRIDPFELSTSAGGLTGSLSTDATADPIVTDVQLKSDTLDPSVLAGLMGLDSKVSGSISGTVKAEILGVEPQSLLTPRTASVDLTLNKVVLPLEAEKDAVLTMDLTANVEGDGDQPLQAKGEGQLDGTPLSFTLAGAAPAALANADEAYPLNLDLTYGQTHGTLSGTLKRPLAGSQLKVLIEGQDPGPVLERLGMPNLELPPYQVSADVSPEEAGWRFNQLQGRVGDSDVAGHLEIDLSGDVPAVSGELQSNRLDLDDLGGLVGSSPSDAPGEAASPGQRKEAEQQKKDRYVFPTEPLEPGRWDNVDVDVSLNAQTFEVGKLTLGKLDLGVTLQGGVLKVKPLNAQVAQGQVEGSADINAAEQPVKADLDLAISRLQVDALFKQLGIDLGSLGSLSGHAKGGTSLSGEGRSIHAILGNADGEVAFLMEGGKLNKLIVEGIGLDVLRLFGSLFGDSAAEVDINCLLADFKVDQGVMTTRALVLDTDAANIVGKGTIDLGKEQLDLTINADPKQASLLRGGMTVNIGGTLAEPSIHPNPTSALARGAAAVALGVLFTPFAAAIPFLEAGVAGDSACKGLVNELRSNAPDAKQ